MKEKRKKIYIQLFIFFNIPLIVFKDLFQSNINNIIE